jgi:hypothetical protein
LTTPEPGAEQAAARLADDVVAKAASVTTQEGRESTSETSKIQAPRRRARSSPAKVVSPASDIAGHQANDIAETPAPSKAEVSQQIALPSDEDVPPPSQQRKSNVKEELIIEEVNNQKANRLLRSTYADKAYALACGCIQFWAVAISCNGIIYGLTGKLMLSDTAMIAMTTGVTVNVLAAFLGVIRGQFPSDSATSKKTKKTRRR